MPKHHKPSRQLQPDLGQEPVSTTTQPRWNRFPLLAVVLLTIVAYAPALRGPQLFDDIPAIEGNPSITRLWPLTVPLNPPKNQPTAGRPIANLSFAMNHALNVAFAVDQGPDPAGPDKTVSYHAVNLLLHIVSGLLLLGLVRRTLATGRFGERWTRNADAVALLLAAAWLLHPLQTSVVDYLMARTDLLGSLFYIATLYCGVRAWDAASPRERRRWYATAVAACLLGMGAKELMVSAPLMVILYDRAFRVGSWRELLSPAMRGRRFFYGALFATLALLVGLLAQAPSATRGGSATTMSATDYLISQGYAIGHYLWLVVWPATLTFDYGRHPFAAGQAMPGLLSVAALGVITVLAWIWANRWGWLAFCGAWFFCILAPSSSIVPLGEVASDRRMYLPLAALLMVILVGAVSLVDRVFRKESRAPTAADESGFWPSAIARPTLAVAGVLLMVLALVAFNRSKLFADPEAIWRDSIAKQPANSRAYTSLGFVLLNQTPPRSAEADSLFRAAVAHDPNDADAMYNLAMSYMERQDPQAEALLERVVAVSPGDLRALALLSDMRLGRGDAAGVVRMLEAAPRDALDAKLLVNLGTGYMGTGRPGDAEAAFRRALEKQPTRTDAMRLLAAMLIDNGRAVEAVPVLEQAVALDPQPALPAALLSFAYAQLGQFAEAIQVALPAAQAGARDVRVYFYAGSAALLAGRADSAESYFGRALGLAPESPDLLLALAKAKAKLGKRAEAIDLFRQVLQVNPNDTEAREGLARLGSSGR